MLGGRERGTATRLRVSAQGDLAVGTSHRR